MSTGRRSATVGVIATLLISCGVPTGPESFEEIEPGDVPNRLNDDTTTTSSTTMPTLPPPAPTLADPDATTTTTTTEPEPPTEIVDIFFLSRGQLRAEPNEVPAPAEANDLILLLEAGPVSDLLDSEIPSNLIESTSAEDGVLTIGLDDFFFERIPARDQREAIAQMVLTFLGNLPGVGQAVFMIDGDRQTVPVGNGQFTDEPVSLDDYENMEINADPDDAAADTTTSTSSTTTTTIIAETTTPTTEPTNTGAPEPDG